MNDDEIVTGILLEDMMLTCDELARACGVPAEWVAVHVEAGVLPVGGGSPSEWRFAGSELRRARRLCALERDFDALPELAALVIDLQEEIARLRRLLGERDFLRDDA